MSTLAEVRLWGKTIGAVSLQDGEEVAPALNTMQNLREVAFKSRRL